MRDDFYMAVEEERGRQLDKWGVQNHDSGKWSRILGEEFGEVCKAANEKDDTGLRRELVEVAAVCLAWLEDLCGATEVRTWDSDKGLWVKS